MQRSNGYTHLKQLRVFSQLSAPVIAALEQVATVYHLAPREVLYRHGDMADCLFVVQSGGVRLLRHTPDGQLVNLKVYGPDDIFGLLAISGPFPHPSEVHAIEESRVVGISGTEARRLMHTFPELSLLVVDLLVDHVHHAHDRLRTMAAERAEQRIARALLHMAQKFGTACDNEDGIAIKLSQQDIAEFTSTTVETVNRTLRIWEKQGLVRRARQQIILCNCDGLRLMVEVDREVASALP